MWPNPQFPTDLVTFTDEILKKTSFFCAVYHSGAPELPNPKLASHKKFEKLKAFSRFPIYIIILHNIQYM